MTDNQISLKEWVNRFNRGDYDAPDAHTQMKAGWFDWFCKDSALAAKTQRLGRRVCQIAKSKRFDPEKVYVFFKNNCPVNGSLYDSFSICKLDDQEVLFWITPRNGHTQDCGKALVADLSGSRNRFQTIDEEVVKGTWSDVLDFFYPERVAARDRILAIKAERVLRASRKALAELTERDDAEQLAGLMV
ncbi:MAG: hypothetical protein WC683_04075 [bacterium]